MSALSRDADPRLMAKMWKMNFDLCDLLTSKTQRHQRPLRSTYPPYLMILVSGIVKLEPRTAAQTDRAERYTRARLPSAWVINLFTHLVITNLQK